MSLWDDIKKAARNAGDSIEDAADEVGDFFRGDEEKAPEAINRELRPKASGNPFTHVNPAYKKRENEFEKPSWFMGADPQSPFSSWDTTEKGFLARALKQQEELQKAGEAGDQFERKDATGVVAADYRTKSGVDLKFGDVFDNGKFIGNLYEDKTGTEADADLMMSQLLLEPEELANIGRDRTPTDRLHSRLQEVREENSIARPQALAAAEQQKEVDETQEGWQEGLKDDIATFAGGFAGGALLGGGLTKHPLGALAFGLGGGFSAFLDRDDLTEYAASAFEITKQAYNDEEGNLIGDTGSAVKQWSGVAGRAITPLSNLVRGIADTDRGNGVGALQEKDRPEWAKPLDIAATIGDMAFTFGSNPAAMAYLGQMSAYTAGGLTELTAGEGMRWDPQAGEFRNTYLDEEGNFSAANAAGAWLSTGIDAAQTAMVKGVVDKITGASTKVIGTQMGGGTVASVEQRAGRTFFLDSNKEVLGSKINYAQAFVPSEGVQLLAATGAARAAAVRPMQRAMTQDDLYKASVALQRADAPIKAALVNAIGEGTEEAVQEALDTWSFDHKVDPHRLAEAYMYGAASGLGMGFAMNYRTRKNDAVEYKGFVESGYIASHGELPADWDAVYAAMPEKLRKTYVAANLDPAEREALSDSLGDEAVLQAARTAANVNITNMMNAFVQAEQDLVTDKAGAPGDVTNRAAGRAIASTTYRQPDGSVRFAGGHVADDALPSGPRQLLNQYEQRLANLPRLLKTIEGRLEKARADQASVPQGGDTTAADEAVASLERTLELWTESGKFLPDLIKAVRDRVNILTDENIPLTDRMRALDQLNEQLDQFYRSENLALSLAASVLQLRSPYDNVASFHVGAPAVSLASVKSGEEVSTETDWASLDVTTADFDGDRFTTATGVAIGPEFFQRARSGASWLSLKRNEREKLADGTLAETDSTTLYKVAGLYTDKNAGLYAHQIHTGARYNAIQDLPGQWLLHFAETVVRRYTGTLQPDQALVDQLYGELEAVLFNEKPKDPIKALMTYFAGSPTFNPLLVEYRETHQTNEASVLVGIWRSYMDSFLVQVNQYEASLLSEEERTLVQQVIKEAPRWNVRDQHRRVMPRQAGTLLNTFFQHFGSDSMLRVAQVIRLSPKAYEDRGTASADTNPLLDIAGSELRVLSQGYIKAAYEGGLSEFDIPAQVRAMALEIFNGDEVMAFRTLTKSFGDTEFKGKDRVKARPNVTVAQALTLAYVQQLRIDAAVSIERDPLLQQKLNLLEKAANDARKPGLETRARGEMLVLRDALGAFNVANLLGVGDTAQWGNSGLIITGSIEQNIRLMASLSRTERADIRRAMELQKVNPSSQPIYDSVIELIFEMANHVESEARRRNDTASETAMKVRANVHDALDALRLERSVEGVYKLFTEGDGMNIVAGFLHQTGLASFTDSIDGDGKALRDWVLQFFAEESDGKAEVLLWRHRAVDSLRLNASRKAMKERDKELTGGKVKESKSTKDYSRLDDSLAALMSHLRDTSPLKFRDLEIELGRATDRKSLEEWIRKQDFGFDAPVLMYENSMGQFDPSLASGGWGANSVSYGSAMRELLTASSAFKDRITKRKLRNEDNVEEAKRLLRRYERDPNDEQVQRLMAEVAKALSRTIKGIHPNDTLEAMVRAHHVALAANDKGQTHEAVLPYDAPQIAEGVQTNFADSVIDTANQLLGERDIQDLRARPELVLVTEWFTNELGQPVRVPNFRDANGNVDPALLLKAIADDSTTGLADLLVEGILPRLHTFNQETSQTTQALVGPQTLKDLITQRYESAFEATGPGKYKDRANATFGMNVTAETQAEDFTYAAAFERAVQALALPRIMSAETVWSRKRIAAEIDNVRNQLAVALRNAGLVYNNDPAGYANAVESAVEKLALDLLVAQDTRAQGRGKFIEYGTKLRTESEKRIREILDTLIDRARVEKQEDVLDQIQNIAVELNEKVSAKKSFSATELTALMAQLRALAPSSTRGIRLLEALLRDDPFAWLHDVYGEGDTITDIQRDAIEDYLLLPENAPIANQVNHNEDAAEAMRGFFDPYTNRNDVNWALLSRIVLSHFVQSQAVEAWSTADKLQVFMEDTHLDPTYSLLLKQIFDPTNPKSLIKAASTITKDRPETVTPRELLASMEALIPADGTVRWDQGIGAETIAIDSVYASSAAGGSAPLHANSGKTLDAIAMAARTTYSNVPDAATAAAYLQSTTIMLGKEGFIGPTEILEGAVGIVSIGGQQVDLEVMVGTNVAPPYQVMTVQRLEHIARQNPGVPLEIQYFHPLRRPPGSEWENSVYFDGVPAYTTYDTVEFPSLIAALYNQADGILQLGTRFVLDAVKAGIPSVHRQQIDAYGRADLAANPDPTLYFTALARHLAVAANLGYDALGPEWFRPALKYMMMRHVVQYADGATSSVSAYMAQQAMDPAAMAARKPELVAMSERTANELYGEAGQHGLRGFPMSSELSAGARIFNWDALTNRQKEVLANMRKPVDLAQTSAVYRRALPVASAVLPGSYSEAVKDFIYLNALMERRDNLSGWRQDHTHGKIDLSGMALRQRQLANTLARDDGNAEFTLTDEMESLLARTGYHDSTFANAFSYHLIVTNSRNGLLQEGEVTPTNFKSIREQLGHLTFGDTAVVDLAGFTEIKPDKLVDIIRDLVDSKVTISLRGINNSPQSTAVLEFLRSVHDYSSPVALRDTFAPREAVQDYVLERAYESRLSENGFSSAESKLFTLVPTGNVDPGFDLINESQSFILDEDERIVVRKALIKQYASVYATPVHSSNEAAVKKLLLEMERDLRRATVKGKIAGISHEEAVDDLMQRVKDGPLSITEKGANLKKGMYEVYVVRGNVGDTMQLYLHRYGSEAIKDRQLIKMQGRGDRFILGPTKTEKNQTTFEGRVVGDDSTNTSDRLLTVESSHVWYGSKRIPLLGGDKGMYVLLPEELDWVRDSVAGRLRAQEISSKEGSRKKLNMVGMAGTFAQAAEIFGFNNMPVFFKGAYGVDYDGSTEHKEMLSDLYDFLRGIRTDSSMNDTKVSNFVDALAGGLGSERAAILSLVQPGALRQASDAFSNMDDSAEVRILWAAITYLSKPGSSLSQIEYAGGFTSAESRYSDRGSILMPNSFARIYDRHPGALKLGRAALQTKLDPGWELIDGWKLRKHFHPNAAGVNTRFQDFDFGFVVRSVTGESIGESFDPTVSRALSVHNVRLTEQFGDVLYAAAYSSDSFAEFVDDATSTHLPPLREASPRVKKSHAWFRKGPHQTVYEGNGDRMLAHYFHEIDLGNEGENTKEEIEELQARIRKLSQTLFKDSSGQYDHMIHYMLRLALGRPRSSEEKEKEASRISLSSLNKGLDAMEANVKGGYIPVRGGAVSLLPLEIRNALIDTNFGKKSPWAPLVYDKAARETRPARTPYEYTKAIYDQALGDSMANDQAIFRQIMDAVHRQYQRTSADVQGLPVSLDIMLDLDLLRRDMYVGDKEFEKFLENQVSFAQFAKDHPDLVKASLYHTTEVRYSPRVMHEISKTATMAQQLGLDDPKILDLDKAPAELLEYVEDRYLAYARGKDIPYQTKASTRALNTWNSTVTDNRSDSHRFIRNLLALHYAKALAQPALAPAAMVDTAMRLTVEDTRRLLTGESLGFLGRQMATVIERQGPVGALMHGLGWRVMFTNQQAQEFKRILNTSATTSVLNKVIYDQLSDYGANMNKQGVIKPIEKLGSISHAIQDLSHGTKSKVMRRNYLQAAITDLVLRQGQDLDTVLANISQDPAWIDKRYKSSSNAGIQAMNHLRGTKESSISSGISALISPLTHSGIGGVNAVAQLTLAMPLMFQKYAAGLFLTLTGMHAFDQLAAHALNGRKKPGIWANIASSAKGQTPETDPYINLDDVIGGMSALDAIINMGVTHSILFTGGMMMSGLGLSGEDEEERRRKRAAAAQGAVWLSDPRDIENDFRNAHALFLDEIPGLNKFFKNESGRSIASPHWIIKPLTSPLLGMERFFETGDIRQLKWGFEDAITSLPLLNAITFNKALTMSEELSHAAQDSAAAGNVGATDSAAFLTHLVSYYEHALFESTFLNALYIGFDDYDRDPYVMPLRDSVGELQRDAEGNTRANRDQHLRSEGLNGRGLALQTYVDDDGNVQRGYWQESGATTDSRILAENRLSYALVSSLFTGLSGKGMNTRYDQAVKTRAFDKQELNEEEQLAVAMGAFAARVGEDGIDGEKPTAEEVIALSFIENGVETLTDEGAMAIMRGLTGGTVLASDAALQGVYLTREQRQEISARFLDELTMEGMRLGLSESTAKYRAGKVLEGTPELPGLADVIWNKNIIPYSKTQEFQQLNTTYMPGPDGNVWATGFSRQKLLGALGLAPLQGMHTAEDTHSDLDGRMNVAGFGVNNTGHRSLRPINDTLDTPTDAEIGDAITKAIEDLGNRDYSGGYGRGGFGGFGGGGGGGYAQRPVTNYADIPRWTNLNFNPITLRVPYANDVYSVRTDNIRTDLSLIRRERISSERNRLSQWQ